MGVALTMRCCYESACTIPNQMQPAVSQAMPQQVPKVPRCDNYATRNCTSAVCTVISQTPCLHCCIASGWSCA
jgi:hypothetical protein